MCKCAGYIETLKLLKTHKFAKTKIMIRYFVLIALVLIASRSFSQKNIHNDEEKCGKPSNLLKSGQELLGDRWGYSYDDLLADIAIWTQDKNTEISNIGYSAQNRKIFELTIADQSIASSTKHRIYIHARTHPKEVQSFWVVKEMIHLATADDELGKYLRAHFIFHFVPMYNPDGVEAELERVNGNNVNLETNWDASAPEAETIALRARFKSLMQQDPAVSVALNMHSAYDCTRYFVYHAPLGTSERFAEKEQRFINLIRSNFSEGIKPYDYYVSWSTYTPTQYPESWWWNNYREQVMALTYEDMNCTEAGMYSTTAEAILKGMAEYFDNSTQVELASHDSIMAYPNPVGDNLTVSWDGSLIPDVITVTDPLGNIFCRKVALTGYSQEIDMKDASAGIYIVAAQFSTLTIHTTVVKR